MEVNRYIFDINHEFEMGKVRFLVDDEASMLVNSYESDPEDDPNFGDKWDILLTFTPRASDRLARDFMGTEVTLSLGEEQLKQELNRNGQVHFRRLDEIEKFGLFVPRPRILE